MERIPVTSKNIQSIGYDADSHTLEVEFNSGGVYQYSSVPQEVYEGFIGADSKGRYFSANIKGVYSFSKA